MYAAEAVVSNVPPGHYTLRLMGGGRDGGLAQQAVDVGTTSVDVTLEPQAWPTINGKVEFQTPTAARHGTLFVDVIDQDTGMNMLARVDADGSFSIHSGPIGKARVMLSGNDGLYAAKIEAQGAALEGDMLDIAGGAAVQLHIVASDESGRVRGFAMNDTVAQEGALVVLAPVDADAKAHEYLAFPKRQRRQLRLPFRPRGRLPAVRRGRYRSGVREPEGDSELSHRRDAAPCRGARQLPGARVHPGDGSAALTARRPARFDLPVRLPPVL